MEYIKYLWFVLPILAAVISAKRFNWFHGIVVFIFTSFMLIGLTDLIINLSVWDISKTQDFVTQSWFSELQNGATAGAMYIRAPYDIVVELLRKAKLNFNVDYLTGEFRYIVYIIVLAVWIILRAMAGKIKNS